MYNRHTYFGAPGDLKPRPYERCPADQQWFDENINSA